MEIFAPPSNVFKTAIKVTIPVITLALGSIWAYSNIPLPDKVLASFFIGGLSLLYFLVSYNYRILLDDKGIIEKQLLKTTQISWHEVDDVLVLPNATIIKSSKATKTISIFHPSPENIFHRLRAVDDNDRLRNLIFSHSIPFLKRVWNEETEQRVYAYPSPSVSSLLVSLAPLLLPIAAIVVFETDPISNFGIPYFYLFSPFLLLSAYLAYRFGFFTKQNVLLINDHGISLKKGNEIMVPWEKISAVTESTGVLGSGSIVVRWEGGPSIVVPKSIDRFCDLSLRIRAKVANRFNVQLNIPLD
jgi:hypothetical protein